MKTEIKVFVPILRRLAGMTAQEAASALSSLGYEYNGLRCAHIHKDKSGRLDGLIYDQDLKDFLENTAPMKL